MDNTKDLTKHSSEDHVFLVLSQLLHPVVKRIKLKFASTGINLLPTFEGVVAF